MRIKKELYNKILFSVPKPPPESGGIMFQKNSVISFCIFDIGKKEYGKYTPDVKMLNREIELYGMQGFEFCGIFHSHFPDGDKLSSDDIEYIRLITYNLKDFCNQLYFPVVLPQEKIVPYKSFVKDGNVFITDDILNII